MKIPQPLPQFEKRALIVVSGDKLAEFYTAYQGVLVKAGEYEFEGPTFTDHEGFFMTSGRGVTVRAGAVYENMEQYVDKKFLKGFQKTLRDIQKERRAEVIYLLTSVDMKNLTYDILPKNFQEMVKIKMVGNYTKKHPLDIIKRINREETGMLGANVPRKLEARKILKKGKQIKHKF